MNLHIDYRSALVTIGSVTKRLPFKGKVDHTFSQIVWDGESGAIIYTDRLAQPFTDSDIVQPFLDMFDIEPPQVQPEAIGASAVMEGGDPEWDELVERHAGTEIAIAALVAAEAKKVTDEKQAKADAEVARRKVFQDQMNAKRRAMGKPERVYKDGDSFAVVEKKAGRDA